MKTSSMSNPFVPAAGAYPPLLVGRQAPEGWFAEAIERLRSGKAVRNEVLVYAPRGHGKTVLTSEEGVGRRALERGVAYLTVEGGDLRGRLLDVLTRHAPMEVQERTLRAGGRFFHFLQGSAGERLGAPAALSKQAGEAGMQSLLEALLATGGTLPRPEGATEHRNGLLLVVDEAHETPPRWLGRLLNAAQMMRRAGQPLLVVLAGTPGLKATLAKANATFWDKSKRFPLGLLPDVEVERALREPLAERGVAVEAGVLARLVQASGRYPFFVQLLGEAVWDALPEGRARIDAEVLERALEVFGSRRRAFYLERQEELTHAGLAEVARRLGERMREEEAAGRHPGRNKDRLRALTERVLTETLGTNFQAWYRVLDGPVLDADPQHRAKLEDHLDGVDSPPVRRMAGRLCIPVLAYLEAKGFVWQAEAEDYGLGIPSLIGFLADEAEPGPETEEASPEPEPEAY